MLSGHEGRCDALRSDGYRLQPGGLATARWPATTTGRPTSPTTSTWRRPCTWASWSSRSGFDSIWATEHYGSAYSMQPNPLQWLAYWAGRTSPGRRRDGGHRGPVVEPGPPGQRDLHARHPARGAAACTSGSAGGWRPTSTPRLGIPIEESHTYFYDVVNAIRAADGAERFTFDGQVFKIPPTTIRPQARHKGDLTTNIKAAFTTEKSARLAAENGLGQMFVVRRGPRRA